MNIEKIHNSDLESMLEGSMNANKLMEHVKFVDSVDISSSAQIDIQSQSSLNHLIS